MSLCRRSVSLIREYSSIQGILAYTVRAASSGVNQSTKDPSNTAASSSSSSSDKGGDQSVYKVPEYYQYNEDSYYDIEMDMLKYRLEQPHPGGKY